MAYPQYAYPAPEDTRGASCPRSTTCGIRILSQPHRCVTLVSIWEPMPHRYPRVSGPRVSLWPISVCRSRAGRYLIRILSRVKGIWYPHPSTASLSNLLSIHAGACPPRQASRDAACWYASPLEDERIRMGHRIPDRSIVQSSWKIMVLGHAPWEQIGTRADGIPWMRAAYHNP
jgi:hypothetical protein